MRTSNPALNDKVFMEAYAGGEAMTIQGTVNKSFVLIGILMVTAWWIWGQMIAPIDPIMGGVDTQAVYQTNMQKIMPWLAIGGIGGFILALVTIFNKKIAHITAPLYAACEGLVLGGVSAIFEMQYPGIVMQAVMLTMGVFVALLMVYKSGMVKVTDNFRLGIFAATGGIAIMYLINFVMGFFGSGISVLDPTNGSVFSIGISLLIVGIAALNLVLDFDFIENGAKRGAPKYMEWYASFGLLVTLIWLYFEILKLLAKMRSRD